MFFELEELSLQFLIQWMKQIFKNGAAMVVVVVVVVVFVV